MLSKGDFSPNSVQRYNGSLTEVVKQTILDHEAIFRKQVHELHRLYKIQKTLMEELRWKRFDGCTSWARAATSQSNSLPSYKPVAEENIFSKLSTVCPMQNTNQHPSVKHEGTYSKLQERPFDLQLPADMYISRVNSELHESRNFWSSPKVSNEAKNFLHSNHVSVPVEMNLSLHTGGGTSKQVDFGRTLYNKETCLGNRDVIDLEESIERASKGTAGLVTCPILESSTTCFGDKHGVQIPVLSESSFSERMQIDQGQGQIPSCSHAGYNESCQKQKSVNLDTGLFECQASRPLVTLTTSKQESSSCKAAHVDLNRIQLDELSCFSDGPLVTHPSPTASSPVFVEAFANNSNKRTWTIASCWKKSNSDSDETSVMLQKDDVASSILAGSRVKDSPMQSWPRCTNVRGNSGSEVGLIDLESLPVDAVELCEDFGKWDVKYGKTNVDLSLGLSNVLLSEENQIGTSVPIPISNIVSNDFHATSGSMDLLQTAGDVQTRQVECEKSEEDTVSSSLFRSDVAEAGYCKELSAASKSSCATDNSSNINDLKSGKEERYELVEANLSAFEESVTTQLGSQVTEAHPGEQDSVVETGYNIDAKGESSDLTNSKHHYKSGPQEAFEMEIMVERAAESLEMEMLVQRAAESLIHISFESSASSQDWISKAGSNELENEESEQPQCSFDSYESIVLRLTESSVDEYSVSSIPIEVNETEEKGCGFKLKRGRRLKDFQRDILPGLISLSRHEICEDVIAMGEIMNSRESRRTRSRKVDGENWCLPVRGRRSRLNYVGRRNYS